MKTTIIHCAILTICTYHVSAQQLISNLFDPNPEYNDVAVLTSTASQKYLGYLKVYYEKLNKLPDSKVLKIGSTISTLAVNHRETIIIGDKRYGLLVTFDDREHKSVFSFKITDVNDLYPFEWIVFDYDHNKGVGYLSDVNYIYKGHRVMIPANKAMQKFESMITMADEIISKL